MPTPTHPSTVHRIIHSAAEQLTPPETSLAPITDPALRQGCQSLYGFTRTLYADMYTDPAAYGMPVLQLEALLNGRTINALKQSQPGKLNKILPQTNNCVQCYRLMLCLIGKLATIDGDTLILTPEALTIVNKRAYSSTFKIPMDVRYKALARVGLQSEPYGDGLRLSAPAYPGMLTALCTFARSFDDMNGFGYFAFRTLAFQSLAAPYKPTYEEYMRTLPADTRAVADAVDAAARALGARPNCNTFWKVDYKYKGKQALCIENSEGDLILRITETYGWDDPALINTHLEKEDADFQRHALRHVWGCTGCSTSHLGAFTTILGKRRRVCMGGGIGFRWINPTQADIPYILKLLQFRSKIVPLTTAPKAA